MRRIAVINQKGGVGKTTTAANLGAALARCDRRVLFLDLDPQAHLTLHLGVEPASIATGAYEVLVGSASIESATVDVRPCAQLVAAHTDLVAAESELVSVVGRELILRDALAPVEGDYDFLIIDCPPSLGILTLNALAAINEVFIPLQPHFLALQGLAKLLETVSLVQARINPGLRVSGIVLCMNESGTRLAGEIVDELTQFLESARGSHSPWSEARLFDTAIRRNIKLAECPSHGQTIFDYAPRSNGAIDYAELAFEVAGCRVKSVDEQPVIEAQAASPERARGLEVPQVTPAAVAPTFHPAEAPEEATTYRVEPAKEASRPNQPANELPHRSISNIA